MIFFPIPFVFNNLIHFKSSGKQIKKQGLKKKPKQYFQVFC